MNNKRLILLLLAVVLVGYGCQDREPVSPTLTGDDNSLVLDKASKGESFSALEFLPFVGPPECARVTSQGKTLLKHCFFQGPISGDLENPEPDAVVVEGNGDFDANGNGRGRGSFILTATWVDKGLSGTFEGHFEGVFTLGIFAGKVHGHGVSGDFRNMQMRATVQELGSPPGNDLYALVGTIR